jgi:hypothetical protein
MTKNKPKDLNEGRLLKQRVIKMADNKISRKTPDKKRSKRKNVSLLTAWIPIKICRYYNKGFPL